MPFREDGVFFRNLKIEPGVEYFLYIGELKSDCLNQFVAETLGRAHGGQFDCISVLPDIMSSYARENVIVINPLAEKYFSRTGKIFSCRPSSAGFAASAVSSGAVRTLARQLIRAQGRLYVHVFESLPELLDIAKMPGVVLLGPDASAAASWNNKTYQLETLKEVVPVIEYRTCASTGDLPGLLEDALQDWKDGVFVSRPVSAGGANSFIFRSADDLQKRWPLAESEYIISRYIPHACDPTVLGVAANGEDVFIAALADQQIEGGNMFRGSVFPSVLPPKVQRQIIEYTRNAGKSMGKGGYRGIFGCDFIVTPRGEVFFVEVNARKQGTTMEMCCTMENVLPEKTPSLIDIEYSAVARSTLPPGAVEMEIPLAGLCWKTYNYKTDKPVLTRSSLPPETEEREIFRRVWTGEEESGMILMEHPGAGRRLKPGVFAGRIAAVARSREFLDGQVSRGKFLLEQSMEEDLWKQ